MSKISTSTPIALPNDLIEEVRAAAQFTGMSQQDVMRLAMRIGLVDLRASKHIAGILQQVATDKGQSFLAWARDQQQQQNFPLPATVADSPPITDDGQSKGKTTAKIARLPRPITSTSDERKAADASAEFTFTGHRKKG